jgi:hypothetical protein
MKLSLSLASVLACSLNAQISSTLTHSPEGRDDVRIRNNSAISLVAFVVMANKAPGSHVASNEPMVLYFDPLIEPTAAPLLPNEERLVMSQMLGDRFGIRRRLLEEPIVTAGILSDGTTTGDAALITRLMLRRSNMLLAVEMALETITDAGKRNVPRKQLIDQFKKMSDSVNRWYLPQEQQIGHRFYQSMIGKLMDLPEAELGAAFPPDSFVAQETATLSRQRLALLKSQPSLAETAR